MPTRSSTPLVRLLFASLLALCSTSQCASTAAADTATCNTYASNAVADRKKAESWGCLNYFQKNGHQWTKEHIIHKRWCFDIAKQKSHVPWRVQVQIETNRRRKHIAACIAKKCEGYATKALAHYAAARRYGCHQLAHYWTTTRQAHINFCKNTTYQNVKATLKRRDERLRICRTQTQVCGKYAKAAVAAAKKALGYRCLNIVQKVRTEWSQVFALHENWCLELNKKTVDTARLKHEADNRNKQIKACIQRYCNDYATKALAHYAGARRYGCHQLARYWTTTRQAHINFCKGTTYQNVEATLKRRDQKLRLCKRNAMSKIKRYVGCYRDTRQRTFPVSRGNTYSASLCCRECKKSGYKYAALQYGSQCFCGNVLPARHRAPLNLCHMRCRREPGKMCGGHWTNSVYEPK